MASVTPVRRGQELREFGNEAKKAPLNASQDVEIDLAANSVRLAHKRCLDLAAGGEGRSSSYAQAVADRSEAIRVLMDTPASSFEGLRLKRNILLELKDWIGQEDPCCCEFAVQLADEMVQFIDLREAGAKRESAHHGNSSVSGPGRWLMGAAVSVPAFFVNRLGLG